MYSTLITTTALLFTLTNSVQPRIDVYRFYRESESNNFYTTHFTDGNPANFKGVSFKLEPNQPQDIPISRIYVYFNPSDKDHFYSTDINEIGIPTVNDVMNGNDNSRIGESGNYDYVYKGKLDGWCFLNGETQFGGIIDYSDSEDKVPLYRYYNSEKKDHLYTTDPNEIGTIIPGETGNDGYVFDSIICYVYPPINPTNNIPPNTTPQGTPGGTPYNTPGGTPYSTAGGTPYSTPGGTPYSTPGGTPYSTPGGTPYSTPGGTPGVTPVGTPNGTPYTTPNPTPNPTPNTTPNTTPNPTPNPTPQPSETTPGDNDDEDEDCDECIDGIERCESDNCNNPNENPLCLEQTPNGCKKCDCDSFMKSSNYPCVSCKKAITGCISCLDKQGCIQCDYKNNWQWFWDNNCKIGRCKQKIDMKSKNNKNNQFETPFWV